MTTIAWLSYASLLGGLLAVSALCAERVLQRSGAAARWLWLVALVVTCAAPAAVIATGAPAEVPAALVTAAIEEARPSHVPLPADPAAATPVAGRGTDSRAAEGSSGWQLERVLQTLIGLSLLLVPAWLLVEHAQLRRRRTRWQRASMDGVPVLVSASFGPAIVGVLRPRVVVPAWVLALEPDQRQLLMLHELEHVRARDVQLLAAGLAVVAMMAWNPAAWWQLARLRLAIETDCDARVLHRRPDVARYGGLLLEVARRGRGAALAVTGFSEGRGQLRYRIERMTTARGGRAGRRALPAAAASVIALLAACVAPRPALLPELALPFGDAGLTAPVGDSIFVAAADHSLAVRRAASDLPASFAVERFSYGARDQPTESCASLLVDERDSTRLRIRRSRTSTSRAVRGDTVVTRVSSTGFYAVNPGGRYGVAADELLRVRCPPLVTVSVNGMAFGRVATTLDTPGDDRARSLARAVASEIGLGVDSLELRPRRVHLAIAAGELAGLPDDQRFERQFDVARAIWRRYGRDAQADTVSISVQPEPGRIATAYFYPEQLRLRD